MTTTCSPYPPVELPPIRAGETDGRYIDLTSDLGAVGDQIPSLDAVSIVIQRLDGFPMTENDLTQAGTTWPNTLDPTGLVLTIGLAPPPGAAGIEYQLILTVNPTVQGRVFIRDLSIAVLAVMG